jgi:transposase
VIDDRPEFTRPDLFPEGTTTHCGPVGEQLARYPFAADTYVVLVTHGHRHDAAAQRVCLRQPAAYLGMIGSRRKVFLILDGHPVHRAAAVQRWLSTNAHRIRVFFLPGYSPELNPDEYLNQDVKTNAVGRQRAATQPELLGNVEAYLRATQRRPRIVRSYFRAEHTRYAAG